MSPCIAVPMILMSLAGGVQASSGGETPAVAPRLLQLMDDGRWIGNAVCYGPHRDGQRPGVTEPSAAEIREDLALMRLEWALLRTYGSAGFAAPLLDEIRAGKLGMKVMLGVWIAATDTASNREEIAAAIELTRKFPDVVAAVCVGNETQVSWSPYPCPLEIIIDAVREVRGAVEVPVTAADDYQYWLTPASRALSREVDFVTTHAHPLWNGRQLDDGLRWLRDQLAAVRAVHPDREVVIGETGWATSVADHGEQSRLIRGAAGDEEQAIFYRALREWAAAERVPTFVFEAFDENWKGGDDPAEVEKHWGLFRADRTAKKALAGG